MRAIFLRTDDKKAFSPDSEQSKCFYQLTQNNIYVRITITLSVVSNCVSANEINSLHCVYLL